MLGWNILHLLNEELYCTYYGLGRKWETFTESSVNIFEIRFLKFLTHSYPQKIKILFQAKKIADL